MDPDVNIFANDLYNFIWWRFKLSLGAKMTGGRMREIIGIAVACQQLLVRNYVNEKFTLRHSYVMGHPGFILEMSTNMAQGRLDFFTHLFRCSAFIAEYYIYRKNCYEATNLGEAPLVWVEMFKTRFIQNFEINGGWEAMISSAERISAEYYPIFEKYESELFVPESRLVPRNLCPSFDKIKVEIILGYAGYDLYDEWKEFRPKSFPCPCKYINARSRLKSSSGDSSASERGAPLRKKSRTSEGEGMELDVGNRPESGPSSQPSSRGSGLGIDLRQRTIYRVHCNRPWERIPIGPYGPLTTSVPDSSIVELQQGPDKDPAVPLSPEVRTESVPPPETSTGGASEDIHMEDS